jgi:hypothetical protein
MATYDLFSKKQRLLREPPSDILSYDLPKPLRVQINYILRDAYGTGNYNGSTGDWYREIIRLLCREYGVISLVSNIYDPVEELEAFILHERDPERALDAVMWCMRLVESASKNYPMNESGLTLEQAVEELNERFKQHGVGYQYEGGEILRLDSTFIHSEIVKPTLTLLNNPVFANANTEYLSAHEHYRHGRNKECLTECLKAFESTMKIICANKGWTVAATATASVLITTIITSELVPLYIQSQMTALRSALESGVPTLRNRIGGHGQGPTVVTADDMTARYVLNLTGSNIIYLAELSNL